MLRRIITEEIAGFMVRIIEIAAAEFYDGDRHAAFIELNEHKVWHHFAEKYEAKCGSGDESLAEEIREMLGKKKPHVSQLKHLEEGDVAFMMAAVKAIAGSHDWNYSVTLEKFYSSGVCRALSGAHIGLSAFTLDEVLEIFDKS